MENKSIDIQQFVQTLQSQLAEAKGQPTVVISEKGMGGAAIIRQAASELANAQGLQFLENIGPGAVSLRDNHRQGMAAIRTFGKGVVLASLNAQDLVENDQTAVADSQELRGLKAAGKPILFLDFDNATPAQAEVLASVLTKRALGFVGLASVSIVALQTPAQFQAMPEEARAAVRALKNPSTSHLELKEQAPESDGSIRSPLPPISSLRRDRRFVLEQAGEKPEGTENKGGAFSP